MWTLSVVVVLAAYCWIFGFSTASWVTIRYLYRNVPVASMRPLAVGDSSLSIGPTSSTEVCGHHVELPWGDLDPAKVKVFDHRVVLAFKSGSALMISCSKEAKSFIRTIESAYKLTDEQFEELYGREISRSDYEFKKAMLNTTPSDMTPFTNRRDVVRIQMLLILKAISAPGGKHGLFAIHTPQYDGFQFSGNTKSSSLVVVELYRSDEMLELIFIPKEGQVKLTQPDINRVVQSIR